jgi:hypothetical protein
VRVNACSTAGMDDPGAHPCSAAHLNRNGCCMLPQAALSASILNLQALQAAGVWRKQGPARLAPERMHSIEHLPLLGLVSPRVSPLNTCRAINSSHSASMQSHFTTTFSAAMPTAVHDNGSHCDGTQKATR